ncbi:MAG TPA: YicC family protein [Mogibacterium sp.]|nr:YicC family protein [Mogibacterium sp.]
MIRSMTGFGRGEYTDDVRSIIVEIRSVNHRYCDIYIRIPRKYSFAEEKIKSVVKNKLSRGKIEITVTVDNFGKSDTDIRLDMDLAGRYYDALKELNKKLGPGTEKEISLSLLAKMPDIINTVPAEEDEEEMLKCFALATEKATEDISQMREAEGAKLADDISERADRISHIRAEIEKRAPELETEYASRLRTRIEELLEGTAELTDERIAIEAAIFADRSNITEELVRLESHLEQLRSFLKSDEEAIGKKIDFLIQEMNREANTIGSKANDKDITSMMLELKAEIEKIREQVQNIE